MNRFDAFSRLSFYSPSPLLPSARDSQVERVRRFLRYDVLPKASLEGGASAGSRSGSRISVVTMLEAAPSRQAAEVTIVNG
jgi:hypothetical protein